MQYKLLGCTGIKVSPLCFGTMSFGGDANKTESAKLYKATREAGINFYDCANVYSNGAAETILGKLMAKERDELVITSKCAMPWSDKPNESGASPKHIRYSVDRSLKRLNTDRLDVLFMHQWDAETPLEVTLRCLDDLVSEGKVLHLGASNYAAWQIAKGLGISDRNVQARFEVIQPMYNLVKRQAESEILPLAKDQRLAVVSYNPVGGGLLSGKYAAGKKPAKGRLLSHKGYAVRYGEDWMFETAGKFTKFANDNGVHPVSLSVAWTASHPQITCPIIGARDVEQLQPSLQALDIDMTPELRAEIALLSRQPAPATDRTDEQN